MAVTQIIGSVCWSWELRRGRGRRRGGGGLVGGDILGCLASERFAGSRLWDGGVAQEGKMELGRGFKWRGYYLMRGASGFRRNH